MKTEAELVAFFDHVVPNTSKPDNSTLAELPFLRMGINIGELADKTLKFLKSNSPKIICLCGSLRFKKNFGVVELEQVLEGNIVLTPCCMYVDAQRTDSFMEHKSQFDKMHFAKIDICDEVFVINKDGYIGDSTRNEIEHAFKKGKVINYLEPIK